ncbi:winged helix-turn-helix transcriptional regulator [bacterium]|nr:winged helix-turn-helix transcriptional regulator [bacterium]
MKNYLLLTKALSDANRVRILKLLEEQELCVCQIIAVIGNAPSTVSKHLSILRNAGLVEGRKDGRWVYYRLPNRRENQAVQPILRWTRESVNDDHLIVNDRRKLAEILKINPSELCRKLLP